MNDSVYLTTPPGRIVMGDVFNGSDKDHSGRPRLDKQGQPKVQFFIGVAFPKNDPAWPAMWQQFVATAQRDFPNGEFQRPGFAWKVVDGDGVNQEGKPFPEYCRGHFVVRMSSGFAPEVYDPQNRQLSAGQGIKRGDYVQCYVAIRGNDDRQKPGLYVNHQMVKVIGYGEAISSGPSAEQAFGAAPAQLPPGASPMPTASGPMPAPAAGPTGYPPQPGNPYPPAPQQAAPMPGGYPTAPGAGYPAQPPAPGAHGPGAPAPTHPAVGYAPPPANPTAYPSNQQPAPYPQILNGPTQ